MLLEAPPLVACHALLASDILACQGEKLGVLCAAGHEGGIVLPGSVVDGIGSTLRGAEEDLVGPVVDGDRVLLVLANGEELCAAWGELEAADASAVEAREASEDLLGRDVPHEHIHQLRARKRRPGSTRCDLSSRMDSQGDRVLLMESEELLLARSGVQDDTKSCSGVYDASILGKLEVTLCSSTSIAVCMLQPEVSCGGLGRLSCGLIPRWGGLKDSVQEWLECECAVSVPISWARASGLIRFIHGSSPVRHLAGTGIICHLPMVAVLPLEDALVGPSAG